MQLNQPADVWRTLEELAANGVVSVYDAGPELVFMIDPEQHLTAAYYRNTIIQGFVNHAIGELAMIKAADADKGQADEVFHHEIDDKSFIRDCLTLGQQMLLQRRIASEESISKASYGNGLSLAKNRGLFDGSPEELTSARRDFAIEVHDAGKRIEAIHALAASHHTGILN